MRERERKRGKREEKKEKKKKREKEKKRKRKIFPQKKSQNSKIPPDELPYHDSKKKNHQKELFGIFSTKVQNLTHFSINSMSRIRFSGSQKLIWKGFPRARYTWEVATEVLWPNL